MNPALLLEFCGQSKKLYTTESLFTIKKSNSSTKHTVNCLVGIDDDDDDDDEEEEAIG